MASFDFKELCGRPLPHPHLPQSSPETHFLLPAPPTGGCVALFDFKELCDRPLAAADYIALANAFHTVAIQVGLGGGKA